ncbi:tetratricopeptide repeat protein [Oscillatoria acuminata]|uniref:protein O-GlcNAc transferase n=1 Tax=Oscillatoria acuminata PCC 6304 TaxID=56110 RepID=K9TBP0_9CYAN|nr:tetratricopeptide repeat protein [Oscillatoria acuminata]AFY80277.1 putative O-linked N-acetylglucosamine transferase, SPINDLY family [Oscillatoria acuminata PCC 6304]
MSVSDREKAGVWIQRGHQLRAKGQWSEAIALYQEALNFNPEAVEAHCQLGDLYWRQGQLTEAIAHCQETLKLDPQSAEAYKTLGNILQSQEKWTAAERAYQQAVQIMPEFAAAHANLGSLYYRRRESERAVACYQKALTLEPSQAGIHWNLGMLYHDLGRLGEAVESWQDALRLEPTMGNAERHLNIGNTLLTLARVEEAIHHYQQAIALEPNFSQAHSNLGNALIQQGSFEAGIAALKTAQSLSPEIAGIHYNLGQALLQQGHHNQHLSGSEWRGVVDCFLQAIVLDPNLVPAHHALFYLIRSRDPFGIDFDSLRQAAEDYLSRAQGPTRLLAALPYLSLCLHGGYSELARENFLTLETQLQSDLDSLDLDSIALLYSRLMFSQPHLRDDARANLTLAKRLGSKNQARLKQQSISLPHLDGGPPHPPHLKIGFLSPHFRRHSIGWCSADILHELSALSAELYLYVTQSQARDDKTAEFENLATQFYQPQSNNFEAAKLEIIEQIRRDNLDILIDLDSVTCSEQLDILYHQPTPICLSWLGFDAPFLSSAHYFLGDRHTHPPGIEADYIEQLIRMPDSFVAVSGFQRQSVEREVVRLSLGISWQQIAYLCVAPGKKLNRELVLAQIQILKQVPNSVLMHKGEGERSAILELYKQACVELGVQTNRVILISRTQTEEQHRTIYECADILLDSYPYNGGTHTLESLWFHLPLVTRVGELSLGRMGYSFLKTLGIESGIAWSWEEYIEWGVRLGQELKIRQEIRHQLIRSKQPKHLSPLWNPAKFAQDMYGIFEALKKQ